MLMTNINNITGSKFCRIKGVLLAMHDLKSEVLLIVLKKRILCLHYSLIDGDEVRYS